MFTRLKALGGNLVVYGIGDAATQIISFFLLPVYVRYLSPADYGVLALLLTVEVVAKVLFRWGIDASFMRLYFDCPDDPARRLLASTQFFFLAAANGTLLAAALLLSPAIGRYLFHTNQYRLDPAPGPDQHVRDVLLLPALPRDADRGHVPRRTSRSASSDPPARCSSVCSSSSASAEASTVSSSPTWP